MCDGNDDATSEGEIPHMTMMSRKTMRFGKLWGCRHDENNGVVGEVGVAG
jgi:hypothetical protein